MPPKLKVLNATYLVPLCNSGQKMNTFVYNIITIVLKSLNKQAIEQNITSI